jgi:hypothetical protein
MAKELRITPEWMSKILNGRVTGSPDIGLRLDDFIRRRGVEPTSIETHEVSSGVIVEEAEPGDASGELLTKARRHFEELLLAAKGEHQRLGWIVEQMTEHLAIPKHWRTHEEINRRARELAAARAGELDVIPKPRPPRERNRETA